MGYGVYGLGIGIKKYGLRGLSEIVMCFFFAFRGTIPYVGYSVAPESAFVVVFVGVTTYTDHGFDAVVY